MMIKEGKLMDNGFSKETKTGNSMVDEEARRSDEALEIKRLQREASEEYDDDDKGRQDD